jgi:predicted ATPase
MIILNNGKGQLGKTLSNYIKSNTGFNISARLGDETSQHSDINIYHTWNMGDKNNKQIQKECLNRFKLFVDNNYDSKIIFTSTYSEQNNLYNFYKQKAEGYLLSNHDNGYVIKLPVLIGKGICQKLKDGETTPYGNIELMTLQEAAASIINIATVNSYTNRVFRLNGTHIPATVVNALLHF